MKRYLLAGLVVLSVGMEASDNPFDLRKNLEILDSDQKALLAELQSTSKNDEILDDDTETKESSETNNKVSKPQETSPQSPALQSVTSSDENLSKTDSMPQNSSTTVSVIEEEELNATMNEAQIKAQMKREEELKAEELALKKHEEELNAAHLAMQKQDQERIQAIEEAKKNADTRLAQEERVLQAALVKQAVIEKMGQKEQKNKTVEIKAVSKKEKPHVQMEISNPVSASKQTVSASQTDKLYLEAIREVEARK